MSEAIDEELLSSAMSNDTDERRPPSGLSPSSIDLYLQCPARFEWEKIDRNESMAGEAAVKGTFVHRVLELLMQQDPEDRTPDMARLFMAETYTEILGNREFMSLALPESDVRSFRRDAWTSVRRYFEMEDPSQIEVVSTEERIEAEIEGVPIRGIIDRLERDVLDDLVITDYKNGKVPIPRYRAPKMRQLNYYAALVEAAKGERPVAGRLVFTAFGEIIDTNFTDESVEDAIATAVEVWHGVHRDMDEGFAPNPGPLCGWCPKVADCAEGKAEVISRGSKKPGARGALGDHAPAWDMVSELSELRSRRSADADADVF
jgi:putative RecB family exonuclease